MLKDWLDKVQNQTPIDAQALKAKVKARLEEIYDPERLAEAFETMERREALKIAITP